VYAASRGRSNSRAIRSSHTVAVSATRLPFATILDGGVRPPSPTFSHVTNSQTR